MLAYAIVSVCSSQAGTVPKRLKLGSYKQCHTIAHGLSFSDAKNLAEIRTASPPMVVPKRGEVGSNWRFSTNISLYVLFGLMTTKLNKLYSTLISQKWCKIGTQLQWNTNRNSYALCWMALFPVTLSDLNYQNHPIFDILYCLLYFHSG